MMRSSPRLLAILPSLLLVTLVAAVPAHAQYFGRNKVQYQTFDFKVLKTDHFDIYFYDRERGAAEEAGRMAERWYARLSRVFNHKLPDRQPVILYESQPQFQQTNAIPGELGEGTGGVTEALRRRIVMPVGGPLKESDHVLGHELVHAFQYDITSRSGAAGLPGASLLPLWFIEGMAEYLSLGPVDPHTAMWLRDAAQHKLPTVAQLEDPQFFPYRFGQALLAYIGGRWGDETMKALLLAGSQRRSMDLAIQQVLRISPQELSKRWHAEIHQAYDPVAGATQAPSELGKRLVGPKGEAGRYNVSPALSPDGQQMMFLSDRGLFSIDLFLADATTGRIKRKITETALDPHFQSIQFINSAGAWSSDGRQFAFAGISGGRPVLDIYDLEQGRIVREKKFKELGEIFNPTWSPDGHFVAFSGLIGGFADLFIYDLRNDKLEHVTDDPVADLQPAWSPDGRSIAFVTERFSTTLEELKFGNYRLALLDLATGEIRPLGPAVSAKQINPQWSPDSRSVYYVSDARGISNVYRLDVSSGEAVAITNLYTGASGITSTSPAISVAQHSGELVLSVFEDEGHAIYRIDHPDPLAAPPLASLPDSTNPAMLPPTDRAADGVYALLLDSKIGLTSDSAGIVKPYSSGLSLDYVSQPSLAAGVDRFGTYVGGGLALFFSDMLGNHNLVTGFQINGSLKDLTAVVGYQNLRHRLNWGGIVQQVPYLTGGFAAGVTTNAQGDSVFREEVFLERQTNREAAVLLSYPFNQVQRVDFTAGLTNIGFDREIRFQDFDRFGNLVTEDTQQLPAPSDINYAQTSAALVFDNSFFGATGPILGQRYRLEVTPTIGNLTMVNGLVDYRRYFLPIRPFTLGARILHYGRYGKDGEDPRLTPLFLGYDGLVRGYAYRSFDATECNPPPGNPNACPVFDQLLGSRILVGNVELRFPLLGVLGVGTGYYGALPLELAFFGDAGVAWNRGQEPTLFGGQRKPVYSAGVAARLNLFGYAILQLDLVRPFDRPTKNWVWQFSLQPGF